MGRQIEEAPRELGYRLNEDAWKDQGRETFLNSENADYDLMRDLEAVLFGCGFRRHENVLRAFRNDLTGEYLELEIGDPDTSGYFLHHFKSE